MRLWKVCFSFFYAIGNFGSSIGALFVFTKWVLMTNLVLSVFWISLVVVPMAISFPYSNVTQGFALGNIVDGQVIELLH